MMYALILWAAVILALPLCGACHASDSRKITNL